MLKSIELVQHADYLDDLKDNEINNKQASNEKLKTIFVTFMKKYNEYLTVFANNTEMNVKQKHDLPIFINTYLYVINHFFI